MTISTTVRFSSDNEDDDHDSPGAIQPATPNMDTPRGTPLTPTERVQDAVNAIQHGWNNGVNGSPILLDRQIGLLAAQLDDLEEVRIRTDNRIRVATTPADVVDADGVARGFGLSADSPTVAASLALADDLSAANVVATRALEKHLRKHPIWGPFLKSPSSRGVGEKTLGRLLNAIGDPYWNDVYERPRTVSELWAYSGLAVKSGRAQRRTKGEQSNWSDDAKKRAWIIAGTVLKANGGPYRKVYDEARMDYATSVHPHDCVRCGPAGKPALAGSLLSAGHQHARAMRRVSKEVLKDLWLVAREAHDRA